MPASKATRSSLSRRSSIVLIRFATSSAELDPDGRWVAWALMTAGTPSVDRDDPDPVDQQQHYAADEQHRTPTEDPADRLVQLHVETLGRRRPPARAPVSSLRTAYPSTTGAVVWGRLGLSRASGDPRAHDRTRAARGARPPGTSWRYVGGPRAATATPNPTGPGEGPHERAFSSRASVRDGQSPIGWK